MKIKEVEKITSHLVLVEENDAILYYVRYSADVWSIRQGETEESVRDCTKLEEYFQAYMFYKS